MQREIKVGPLIKDLRKAKGMTQMELAELVGISYQQIQKYEKGVDRVTIDRLYQISDALHVPIMRFFQGAKDVVSETPAAYGKMTNDERLLLQFFREVKNMRLKKAILRFIKAVVRYN